jgi:HEAT repeat protein
MKSKQLALLAITLGCLALGSLLPGCGVACAGEDSTAALINNLTSADSAVQLRAIDELGAQGAQAAEAVAPLTGLLKNDSAAIKAHAACALGEIGTAAKPAVPSLAELLKDSDQSVRRQAVKAVIRIHPGPQVTIPLCVKLLEDSDPGVRLRILNAVADVGAPAVPGLIEALKNQQAAYWACLVLREIGPAAKAAVPALAAKLQDKNPEVRREAILALAAMDEAARPAIPQIAAALGDENTRHAATYALGRIGQIPTDAEATVRANVKSDDKVLSTASLWALARVHPDDKQIRREAGGRLIERLKDKDPLVRGAAAQALAALPPAPEIMAPLWEKALQDADEATVRLALGALAKLGPPAVPRLIDALKHEKLRVNVVFVLGEIGPVAAPATPALTKLIADKDDSVAHEAAIALAKIGPEAKAAVPELVKALSAGDESSVPAVAYALGRIGPDAKEAVPALRTVLKGKEAVPAEVSAWALAHIEPSSPEIAAEATPVLVKALSSPQAHVRLGAAEALGEIGASSQAAREALQKAASSDEDPAVRAAAAKALKSEGNTRVRKSIFRRRR